MSKIGYLSACSFLDKAQKGDFWSTSRGFKVEDSPLGPGLELIIDALHNTHNRFWMVQPSLQSASSESHRLPRDALLHTPETISTGFPFCSQSVAGAARTRRRPFAAPPSQRGAALAGAAAALSPSPALIFMAPFLQKIVKKPFVKPRLFHVPLHMHRRQAVVSLLSCCAAALFACILVLASSTSSAEGPRTSLESMRCLYPSFDQQHYTSFFHSEPFPRSSVTALAACHAQSSALSAGCRT
jgi:hypothetical protein